MKNFMNSLKRFWNQWHNKFLAILFISFGLLFLGLNYLVYEIFTGWTYFMTEPTEIINFAIYLIVYLIILYGNVKNSNIAYNGILMFLFMLALDVILQIVRSLEIFFLSPISIFMLVFMLAQVVSGIMLYVKLMKYINYQSNNFTQLRILGVIFASLLGSETILLSFLLSPLFAFLYFSETFCAVSLIFTVERIRRD